MYCTGTIVQNHNIPVFIFIRNIFTIIFSISNVRAYVFLSLCSKEHQVLKIINTVPGTGSDSWHIVCFHSLNKYETLLKKVENFSTLFTVETLFTYTYVRENKVLYYVKCSFDILSFFHM